MSPYIVTTTRPSAIDCMPIVRSRLAVATLEDAHIAVLDVLDPHDPHTTQPAISIPECGGTLELPDGTALEVERADRASLCHALLPIMSGLVRMTTPELVAAFNAQEMGLEPYDAEEFKRFRESRVGQRIAEIAREPLPETREGTISAVIREVLIAATDIVPHGSEPFVGWSAVLADRIAEALVAGSVCETFEDTIGCDMCGAHIDDPCDCDDPQKERRSR